MLPIQAGPPATELFNILLRIDFIIRSRSMLNPRTNKNLKFLSQLPWAVMHAITRFCSRCEEAVPIVENLAIGVSPLASLLLKSLRR